MQYLAWRVLVGKHKTITLSFLIVGHTKFAPDWAFGLLKQRFRKTKVDCLDDIAEVVRKSAEVNEVQLVATQDGEVLVHTYNWADFFDLPFNQTALKGIKTYHHFRFTADHPGYVFVKTASDQPEKKIRILSDTRWSLDPEILPNIVQPAGLSDERKLYLYEKIREFCRPEVRDQVCPNPRRDDRRSPSPEQSPPSSPPSSPSPPRTKKR